MSYLSTRGGAAVTASQAILTGLAPGGGLYVPAMFPQVDRRWIANLSRMSYAERAVAVLSHYLEDYTPREIEQAVQAAYAPARFDDPAIAPLRTLTDSTYLLELFLPRDAEDNIKCSAKALGFRNFATLTVILVLVFCLVFFSLETFSFFNWLYWLECVIGSLLLTLVLIFTLESVRK